MIDGKLNIIKREYYTMSRISKPKPPPTDENLKVEDLLKNKTMFEGMNIEDLIVSIFINSRKMRI